VLYSASWDLPTLTVISSSHSIPMFSACKSESESGGAECPASHATARSYQVMSSGSQQSDEFKKTFLCPKGSWANSQQMGVLKKKCLRRCHFLEITRSTSRYEHSILAAILMQNASLKPTDRRRNYYSDLFSRMTPKSRPPQLRGHIHL
jgi:hypothetical protein